MLTPTTIALQNGWEWAMLNEWKGGSLMSERSGGTSPRPPDPPPLSSTTVRLYMSYLLRLWASGGDGERGILRASLESPLTHELLYFPDLESVFDFLKRMAGSELAVGRERA